MEEALRALSQPEHDLVAMRLQHALDVARGQGAGGANDLD
jgi:hypothetical protein